MRNKEKRDVLILAYQKYAEDLALRFCKKHNLLHMLDDYKSIAVLGLCRAAHKFKPKFKNKETPTFASFSNIYIVGGLYDELRSTGLYTRAQCKMRSLGEEIEALTIVSIEEPLNETDEDNSSILDTLISEDKAPDEIAIQKEAQDLVKTYISKLPKVERVILCLSLSNKYLTYRDMGYILGFSESRVAQLLIAAKKKMKEALDEFNKETMDET